LELNWNLEFGAWNLKSMRILFIQPTADKKGHYGKYSVNLCQQLAKQGHEVVLFTNKVEPERFMKEEPLFKVVEHGGGIYSFEKFDEAKKTKPWLYLLGYLRNSFVITRTAFRYSKRERFDIIQVTDVEFGILSLLLLLYRKHLSPVVLLLHAANFSFSKYPGNIIFRFYKVFQREILRTRIGREIKAIVTLGEYHKEELQKQFRLPAAFPIKVIYDGAEPPTVWLSREEARQKLGIYCDGQIFLLFGNLRKDKGIEYLLEAAQLLSNKKPAFGADSLGNANNSGALELSSTSSIAAGLPKIKNPAKSEASDEFRNDPIKPDLASTNSIANQKALSSPLSRGPAENRTPETLMPNQVSDHPGPTAKTLYQKNYDFKILIAGSPFDYEPKDISDMVMKFGLEDKVILRLGYISDEELPLYFFAADCVIFPYRKIYTGGTGPLLKEAAMFKKPVIVSDVSEMGRLVKNREMGLVFEPENAGDLARRIREFLQTPGGKRREWGENAFNAANTWEKMAKQYLEIYRDLLRFIEIH
jgi:glycosyltransferase involved in cell wall biosynthesis